MPCDRKPLSLVFNGTKNNAIPEFNADEIWGLNFENKEMLQGSIGEISCRFMLGVFKSTHKQIIQYKYFERKF